jgi:hypothetical protein
MSIKQAIMDDNSAGNIADQPLIRRAVFKKDPIYEHGGDGE